MKRVSYLVAPLAVAIAAFVIVATPLKTEKSQTLDEFMLQKRDYAQACLDALMNEDYEKIVIAGENLKRMKLDKRWNRIQTDEYKRQSEILQMRAQAMTDAARTNNLEDAMEGYMKTLRTCFDCHKYVRNQGTK